MQARIEQVAGALADPGRMPAADALAERLDNLCRFPPAASATQALAASLVALRDHPLPPAYAARAARQVYVAMNGGYLRRRDLDRLADDIARELRSAGAPDTAVVAVRSAVLRVAREPRDPRRDWW